MLNSALPALEQGRAIWSRLDKPILAGLLIVAAVGILAPLDLMPILTFVLGALAKTSIYIFLAVTLIATLKATGAEGVVAKSFQGNEVRMIILASLLGGLAPFCSCEVIPFIAALLAAGTPLSAVMAFWLSSPVMDPPMFMITAGKLGFDFAVAKTLAAVGFGLAGGFGTMLMCRAGLFANPLREALACKSCCGSSSFGEQPRWRFWSDRSRTRIFRETFAWNAGFLLKWLALAYVLEALMIWYVPSELVVSLLGGDGIRPVATGAVIGGPAYLNGYAAVPLVAGMLEQGMYQGAAMSFVLAGSVTSVPAAVAVWALVRPRVFSTYVAFAMALSLLAGMLWAAAA